MIERKEGDVGKRTCKRRRKNGKPETRSWEIGLGKGRKGNCEA
jgi:hypothetical protein